MKNLEQEKHFFKYLAWLASLTEEQFKEEINEIELEEQKRESSQKFRNLI